MNEEKIQKTEEEWKKELSSEEYKILREKGTERPFSGEYVNNHDKGTFVCKACGNELFGSEAKFDSGTGWPSFDEPKNLENVELRDDNELGMRRTEVLCRQCGSHLGHIFPDGPTKTGNRYCINSACLLLKKEHE